MHLQTNQNSSTIVELKNEISKLKTELNDKDRRIHTLLDENLEYKLENENLRKEIDDLKKSFVTNGMFEKGINFLAGKIENLESPRVLPLNDVAATSKAGIALSKDGYVSFVHYQNF